jgi:3-oxoacyl-[acyl-carrier-protein] synthase II
VGRGGGRVGLTPTDEPRDVVVTGVGAVTPLGVGARTLFDRWREGVVGISDGLGRCLDFEPGEFLSVKDARRTDRFAQLAVGAADEALTMAGWSDGIPFDTYRVACVIGTGIGGIETLEEQHRSYREAGSRAVSPLVVPRIMGNAAAAALAMRYGLHGPSAAVASACASGADAVAAGARLIQSGQADAAVVGGAESAVSPFIQAAFRSLGAISASGVCRPFDARRDGFVLGEAAGVVVLEDGAFARARGTEVLGRFLGAGTSSDAFHLTAPDPTAAAAARAIEAALRDAAIIPEDVDYVNAHGTGTQLNDRAETDALKAALGGACAHRIPVSSTKSAIGHTLGAAGAVEAIAALLAARNAVAPPTLGYEVREEGLDLDYAGDGCRVLPNGDRPLVAMSNSFGFGGHNVVLVVEAEHV